MNLQIRRMTYADLPQVVAIERRAFPAPWSLAMFVLELSKPSGICLAAVVDERLAEQAQVVDRDALLPEYVRLPDAKPRSEQP